MTFAYIRYIFNIKTLKTMAKVTLSPAFESLSGTLCSRSGDYVALNKQTGKMYLSKRHESNHVATEAQEAVMQTFTSRSQFASAWWNANKPQSTGEKGSEEYQLVMKAYKAQRKIGNPYAYLLSLVSPDLHIVLGGNDITGDLVSSGGSGDTSNPSGSGSPDSSGGTSKPSGGGAPDGGDEGEG